MLKNILLPIACFGLIVPGVLMANGYQYEANFSYSSTDDNFLNETTTVGSFRMYLDPVTYENRPYNEVAFLARQSNVQISVGQTEYEINLGIAKIDLDSTLVRVNLEYAEPGNPVIIGLGFENAEGDEKFFGQDVDVSSDGITASAGYYIDPFSRIGVLASKKEIEIATNTGAFDTDTNTYFIEYVTLQKLSSSKFYSMEARLARVELEDVDLDIIQVGGNYYSSFYTSIGGVLGFVSSDEDGAEGQLILVRAKHFVDPYTSIAISFDKFNNDDDNGSDSETINFAFFHRF